MEPKLIATHLQLEHGDTILVIGRCWEDAKSFVVNLGQDCENVVLHFNPRFNYQTDVNVIVCNFKKLGKWGAEKRLNFFPFEQGGKFKRLVVTYLNLQHGETVEVMGKMLPDCKEFAVDLGQDSDNVVLHFNPRFDCKGDVNTIVCNSKENAEWGEEQRETNFPFEQGGNVQLSVTFLPDEIKVLVAEGHEISILNRLGLKTIDYLAVKGDFKVQVLKFL